MEIIVSHSEAKKQHPEIVKKWMKDAKSSGIPFNTKKVKWSYAFCVKVDGVNGNDFVNKLRSGEIFDESNKRRRMTPEDVAEEVIENVVGLSINVSGAGLKREKLLKKLPKLFVKKYKSLIIEAEEESLEEQRRFDRLTPQEKRREEEEIVNELFGEGAFSSMGINNKHKRPRPITYDMDEILDKVSKVGIIGLSEGEKKFMEEHSKNLNKK